MDDKELLKSTGLQKKLEDQAEKKMAEDIEEENAVNTKNARIKLEKAKHVQKSTIDELHKQNEKLLYARDRANVAFKQSKEAREKANQLLYEKNFCTVAPKTRAKFKNWREGDQFDGNSLLPEESKEVNSSLCSKSAIDSISRNQQRGPEEKTDRELRKLYEITVQINHQTEEQKQAGSKQKNILKDVIKTSEGAGKEIKKTGEKLDEFN